MARLLFAAVLFWLAAGRGVWAAPRVVSLDQCADQFVLALSPRAAIAGLSYRAGDGDSYLSALAAGLPRRRATLESVLAAEPEVAIRYWGGDAQLLRRLQAHGVRVVTLSEARDFDGVRANVRLAGAALGDPAGGERLIAAMDRTLREAALAPGGPRVAYLTPGGATAGPGTLIDAVLTAAGLKNVESRPGYRLLSLERLALQPPQALVLGFFDDFATGRTWWSPARNSVMRAAAERRALASLPGSVLSCPGWFAADAVRTLVRAPRT